MKAGIALIVVAACLILGPLAAHAYNNSRQSDRIAEFYTRNGNAATLPSEMMREPYSAYDFICLIAGAVCLKVGIARSKQS